MCNDVQRPFTVKAVTTYSNSGASSAICVIVIKHFNNIIIVVEKQTVQAVIPLLLLSVIPFGCSRSALGAELKPNARLKTKYEIEVVFNGKSINIQPLYRWQAIESYKLTKREKQNVATKQTVTKWGKTTKPGSIKWHGKFWSLTNDHRTRAKADYIKSRLTGNRWTQSGREENRLTQ